MGVVKEPLAQWEIDILRQLADEKPNNVGLTGGQLLEILTRLEQAEQTVARVREVAAGWATNDRPFREALLRTLDGDGRG